MAEKGTVAFDVIGHVALITIRRASVRNAVDAHIANGLEQAIDRLEDDADLRAGVLAAEGKVFSAGADLSLISEGRREEMYTDRGGFAGMTARSRVKPLIAAVDGPAVAGGFEIALACDWIVASRAAYFSLPEVKRSLVAAGGGLFRVMQALPRPVALAMLLTGEPLDAERAYALGMITELCDPGQAAEAALATAKKVASNAPLAVWASKRFGWCPTAWCN